jgi:Domain of unknown function (DUF4291)
MQIPQQQIRARFDAKTIVVYQAYNSAIADAALEAQRLVPPFSVTRMTWVKPSFLWMMERCGWATKPNQERVLAISLHRAHFDAAVANAISTSQTHEGAALRVQWDPERNLRGGKLEYRSLQLGIGRALASRYAGEWISRIEDVTPLVKRIDALRTQGDFEHAGRLLPDERVYG